MKKVTYLLTALAIVLGLSQCKKEQPVSQEDAQGVFVSIAVSNGGGTRAQVDPATHSSDGYASVAFETNDKIYVGFNNNYVGVLTATVSGETATFSGELDITEEQEHGPFDLYFLGQNGSASTVTSNSVTVSISDQTEHAPVVSYGRATYNSSTNKLEATMVAKCSIMKFNVTTPSTAAICITGMKNEVTVNFATPDGTDNGFSYEKDGEGVIKMKGQTGSGEKIYWAIVLPQVELDEGGANSVYSTDGYAGTRPAIHAIESNKYYNSGILMEIENWDGVLEHLTSSSTAEFATATDGMTITGTLSVNKKVSIADGATVTLDNASINAAGTWSGGTYAGITCLGNATIILSGTNTVKGFYENYPGIFVPSSKTLIIQGTGSLTASSNGYGAGIGGGFNINCGNIEIQGGVITATGGRSAAGIGGGSSASCGTITINNTVTSVTATKGEYAPNSIGAGNGGTCGTVTIGGVVGAITTSPYTYPAPVIPSGAIDGLFSVSSTKQVYFSKGNLQAVGTTSSSPTSGWTWQFAEHQYDYIGGCSFGGSEPQTGNNYISGNGTLSANGTVDLFGWSTNATYYGIHDSDDASTYSGAFYDWGNAIGSGWRTLSKDEWLWVLGPLGVDPDPGTNCRTSSTVNGVENARYAGATVAGKAGLIIFPDSYTHPGDVDAPESESINTLGAAYDSNSYDATAWGKMEAAGAVFLPAAGFRPAGNIVQECEVSGYYWSSVLSYSDTAYSLMLHPNIVFPLGFNYINQGCSVRLVKDAN